MMLRSICKVRIIAVLWFPHGPRNFIGVPNRSFYLAGAGEKIGASGQVVPSITPDKETGIGDWKRENIAELLTSGITLIWITCRDSCTR